jgi:hypothetical protein
MMLMPKFARHGRATARSGFASALRVPPTILTELDQAEIEMQNAIQFSLSTAQEINIPPDD